MRPVGCGAATGVWLPRAPNLPASASVERAPAETPSRPGRAQGTMTLVPGDPPSNRRLVAAARRWWMDSIGHMSWRRMRELDLDTHALALCAQQVLCTAPLIVAMSAVVQRLTGRHPGYFITRFFGLYGDSADAVERLFSRTSPSIGTPALVLAMVTAI